jgi:hypothetical protein
MSFLDALNFHDAIWLLPCAVLLHVLEELPRFPGWANQHLTRGPGLHYTRGKFIAENTVLFLLLCASLLMACLLPAASIGGRIGLVLTLGAAAGVLFNVVFHAYYTLRTGIYSPGTVTACLLFAPVTALVFSKASRTGLLTPLVVAAAAVLGLTLLPLVVAVVHRLVDRGLRPRALLKVAPIVLIKLVLVGVVGFAGQAAAPKVMAVLGPVALLGLVVKWVVQRSRRTATGGTR